MTQLDAKPVLFTSNPELNYEGLRDPLWYNIDDRSDERPYDVNPTFNSFSTLADVEAYYARRPRGAPVGWNEMDDTVKCNWIRYGTEILNTGVEWEGDRIYVDQPLEFPRKYLTRAGEWRPNTRTPQEVIDGLAEYLVSLIAENRQGFSDDPLSNLTSARLGKLSIDRNNAGNRKLIPDDVYRMFARYAKFRVGTRRTFSIQRSGR